MKLKLTVKRPPAPGQKKGIREVISLDQACCIIGRNEADVLISDSRCSSQHALMFESFSGKLRIRDLDSTNGTLVNGEPVEETDLKVSDEILIGKTIIVVADFTSSTFSKITLEAPGTVRPDSYRNAMPRNQKKKREALPPPEDIVISNDGNFGDLTPQTASHVVQFIDENGTASKASISQILNLRRLVDEDE